MEEKKMIKIGRMYKFESAHFLPNHEGKCKNMHGHQWKVEVVVKGYPIVDGDCAEYGMVMDYKRLDEIVDPLIFMFDHKVINDLLPNPTAENIALKLAVKIPDFLPNRVALVKVRVWESENSYAEWTDGQV